MKNTGKPCSSIMYTVPEHQVTVDTITVETPPKHGIIRIQVPQFHYTPTSGFTGQDRFVVSAEGPDAEKRQRIKLRGEVTVRVEP